MPLYLFSMGVLKLFFLDFGLVLLVVYTGFGCMLEVAPPQKMRSLASFIFSYAALVVMNVKA